MYGTVARIKVKPGQMDAFIKVGQEMGHTRGDVYGYIGSYILRTDADADTAYIVALFENKQLYFNNAEDPAQGEAYAGLRELMAAEPEWNDGEIVSMK